MGAKFLINKVLNNIQFRYFISSGKKYNTLFLYINCYKLCRIHDFKDTDVFLETAILNM